MAKPGKATPRRTLKGGTARARVQAAKRHEEDHVDVCDFEVHASEATSDAELPAARGGVAARRFQRGAARRT
jgi:hypothetical protein